MSSGVRDVRGVMRILGNIMLINGKADAIDFILKAPITIHGCALVLYVSVRIWQSLIVSYLLGGQAKEGSISCLIS